MQALRECKFNVICGEYCKTETFTGYFHSWHDITVGFAVKPVGICERGEDGKIFVVGPEDITMCPLPVTGKAE